MVKRATLAGVAGALDVPNISTAMYESGPLASAIKTGFTLCSELEDIMATTRLISLVTLSLSNSLSEFI